MGITVDGERSRKRMWFARRMLAVARDLGLPAMGRIWDGFRFRVTNLDPDLEDGRITAPCGAVVLCSKDDGIDIHSSEWVFSAVGPAHKLQEFPTDTGGTQVDYVPKSYTYSSTASLPPVPAVSEYVSETYIASVAGPHSVNSYEYAARGRFYLPGSKVLGGGGYYGTPQVRVSLQPMRSSAGYIGMSVWVGAYRLDSALNKLLSSAGLVVSPSYGVGFPYALLEDQFSGVPSGLRTEMVGPTTGAVASLGGYAYNTAVDNAPVILNVADARLQSSVASPPPGHPEYADWYAFFSIYDMHNAMVSTRNSTHIAPVLVSIFGSVSDNDDAIRKLEQLVGWPTQNDKVPPDTAMFHDDSGNIYTWTRAHGSVRWNVANGLVKLVTPLVMPAAVSGTNGVRPEIYNLGGGLFLCIAFKPGKLRVYGTDDAEKKAKLADWIGVRGLYIGSPFTSWTEIALPTPATYRTLSVRAIKATATEQVFAAVVSDIPGTNDPNPPAPKHWFAMRLDGQWRILSPLRANVTDRDRVFWATGLYGDDPMVKDMQDCLAQPVAYPQAVVLPYSEYAGLIP